MNKISPWFNQAPDMRRYPPLEKATVADIVIIGGGITGVLTAYYLTKQGINAVLIEKNHLATGDTGATTGFLTRVPDVDLPQLKETYGIEFIKKLFQATAQAQNRLFQLINQEKIACDFTPCRSYFVAYEKDNQLLQSSWEIIKLTDPQAHFITSPRHPFAEAIQFDREGKFHPRKFIFNLIDRLKETPLRVFEETEAVAFEKTNPDKIGTNHDKIKIATNHASILTNKVIVTCGNPSSLLKELSSLVENNISYVAAAQYDALPLSDDIYWDTLDPYFYYRKTDHQTMLLGGADISAEKTTNYNPYPRFERFLNEHIKKGYQITHQWSGSIFNTKDHLPYIFRHPHQGKIIVATGFAGNGLVFSHLAADLITDLAMDKTNESSALFSLKRTGVRLQSVTSDKPKLSTGKRFVPFARIDEFKKKKVICKTINNAVIVVFQVNNAYCALDNNCSHAGGSLCDGTLSDRIIQCPLHGARFDVTTGAVLAPPAIRPQTTYKTRIVNNMVEVEMETTDASSRAGTVKRTTHWGVLIRFTLAALLFWLVELAGQYFWLSKDNIRLSLVRSFALAGETLIGAALFSSAIFKWFPRTAVHWRIRRYLGVSGFILIFFHVATAMKFLFNYDLKLVYYSLNPLVNPIIFGVLAYPIFFVMAATSTDWMVKKLTPRVWKFIHRFVYVAYISSIFHFILINPQALNNPLGYLLYGITALALFGQVFWFFKLASQKKFRSVGSLVGLLLIAVTLIVIYLILRQTRFSR